MENSTKKYDVDAGHCDQTQLARMGTGGVWLKKTPSGFSVNGQTFEFIEGQITYFKPHALRWVNGDPEKVPLNGDGTPPEGYDYAVDLAIETEDAMYNFSADNKTGVNNLAHYAQNLDRRNLHICGVVTRLRVRSYQGKYRAYSAIDFDLVRAADPLEQQEENDTVKTTGEEALPF